MGYGNGRPHINLPGRINVGVDSAAGPWASPVVVPIQVQDGIKAMAFGGLSREEALAAPILAAILADPRTPDEVSVDEAAAKALDMAEALLRVSAQRAQARMEAANKPKIEGA